MCDQSHSFESYGFAPQISKKSRLLKFCCVPLLGLALTRAFLQQPLAVLTRQTRQAVHAFNQSVYFFNMMSMICSQLKLQLSVSFCSTNNLSKVKGKVLNVETWLASWSCFSRTRLMAGSILPLTKSTTMCLSQSYENFFFVTDVAAKKLERLSLAQFLFGQPDDFE
jgi:hypothetical protein